MHGQVVSVGCGADDAHVCRRQCQTTGTEFGERADSHRGLARALRAAVARFGESSLTSDLDLLGAGAAARGLVYCAVPAGALDPPEGRLPQCCGPS